MATKVTTMFVNETQQPLVMKVGNGNCFVRVASVKRDGEYALRRCVDWTYQEFVLQDKDDAGKKLVVNSDDCCDYERIIVKSSSDGNLAVETVPRRRVSDKSCGDEHTVAMKSKFLNWRFWL